MSDEPLTLGTAGHIDHGKTALVGRLTGVATDRLPEERERGMSIALGYAPLALPSGRRLSVVDVPGHERFVRTMVAGATGVDLFLLVIAADDGVMPQTREHLMVLRGLGVQAGVVAVTKSDVADPARALAQAGDLLPGTPAVACSSRTGAGMGALREALDRVAAGVRRRREEARSPVLHLDRVFTLPGAGVVVTGTLWSGTIGRGDVLLLSPSQARVRVRGVQVHDEPVGRAAPGQRVAVALTGIRRAEVEPGHVLMAPGAAQESRVLDCALDLHEGVHGQRVHVHHGTRAVPARVAHLEDGLWQLRLEQPLAAADGDRLVVRRPSPPDTLGGGVVLDAAARRHGRRPEILERLRRRRDGRPEPVEPAPASRVPSAPTAPPPLSAEVLGLEERLRAAGPALLRPADSDERAGLVALRAAGRAVRLRGDHYAHPAALAAVRDHVVEAVGRDGGVTLASLRDQLGLARRQAQALLEHLDSERVTRRLPDDRRVLSHRLARERVR
jgi:selenocysteine-specific elongation factor